MAKKTEKPKKDKKKKDNSAAVVEGKSPKAKGTALKEKRAATAKEAKAEKISKKPTKAKESIKVKKENPASEQDIKEAVRELSREEWSKRHDNWDSSQVFDESFLNEFGLEDNSPLENCSPEGKKDSRCVHCGAEVFPGQAFCSRCGAYITDPRSNEQELHAFRTNKFIKASIIGIMVFCVLAIVVALLPPGHDLQPMYDKYCNEEFATISEGGSQLMIDTNPANEANFYNQDAFEAIEKVNEEIGLPVDIATEMKNTSGGEGAQRVSVHHVEVMWSYHPDRGLEVVYTVIN